MKGRLLVLTLGVLVTALLALGMSHEAGAKAVATGAEIAGDEGRTEFSLTLSEGVTVEVFTLANPYRVILDMPDVAFRLPDGAGRAGRGLVKAYRYGLFAARKARVVIDTVAPVEIENAAMYAVGGSRVRLKLTLRRIDEAAFGAGTGADRAVDRKASSTVAGGGPKRTRAPLSKPVIVIDPGHGGVDPGAVGDGNVYEKNVVLQAARELKKALSKQGDFDVHMTRTEDVFLSLDERLAFSRDKDADLFISLHADAIADKRYVDQVRGATVYTLSDDASDEMARLTAEKENSADAIAGLPIFEDEGVEEVRDILIDLVRRETANFSADFSRALISRMKTKVRLSRKPQRSAAFKVLRQTSTPSVLVELGYLSNGEDQKQLTSPSWRRRAAQAIAQAVGQYFRRRTADAR